MIKKFWGSREVIIRARNINIYQLVLVSWMQYAFGLSVPETVCTLERRCLYILICHRILINNFC